MYVLVTLPSPIHPLVAHTTANPVDPPPFFFKQCTANLLTDLLDLAHMVAIRHALNG